MLKNRLSNNAGGVKHFLGRTGPCISHTKEKTGLREVALTAVTCAQSRPVIWSYDFVSAMTHDGRTLRILTLIDEYTRECLALRVARRLGSLEVIDTFGRRNAGARGPGAHPLR